MVNPKAKATRVATLHDGKLHNQVKHVDINVTTGYSLRNLLSIIRILIIYFMIKLKLQENL
jgi:hypothetical protein